MTQDRITDIEEKSKKSNSEIMLKMASAFAKRKTKPLHIVFAGDTYAGKSTLINLLFNPEDPLPVGDGKSGTEESTSVVLELGKKRGTIIYTDLPGLGRDKKTHTKAEEEHLKHIEECDLVLWLFKFSDTSDLIGQLFFDKLSKKLKSKILFGISKIDIDDKKWDDIENLPSESRMLAISRRCETLKENFNISDKVIIEFSSHKKFNIDLLINMMIKKVKGKGDVLRHKFSL